MTEDELHLNCFDSNICDYDKYRNKYCLYLFDDIKEYSKINNKSNILEIGCGPGNATLPFLLTGARITAIEIGENLSNYVAEKFKHYKNFKVINDSFENYYFTEKYDLIFSGTAFHWIPDIVAYPKCLTLLNEGGTLATFWNKPIMSSHESKFAESIYNLTQRYVYRNKKVKPLEEKYRFRQNQLIKYGYKDVFFKEYSTTSEYVAEEYIGLLHTYPDIMDLSYEEQSYLFNQIRRTIPPNEKILLENRMDLHMGRNAI